MQRTNLAERVAKNYTCVHYFCRFFAGPIFGRFSTPNDETGWRALRRCEGRGRSKSGACRTRDPVEPNLPPTPIASTWPRTREALQEENCNRPMTLLGMEAALEAPALDTRPAGMHHAFIANPSCSGRVVRADLDIYRHDHFSQQPARRPRRTRRGHDPPGGRTSHQSRTASADGTPSFRRSCPRPPRRIGGVVLRGRVGVSKPVAGVCDPGIPASQRPATASGVSLPAARRVAAIAARARPAFRS